MPLAALARACRARAALSAALGAGVADGQRDLDQPRRADRRLPVRSEGRAVPGFGPGGTVEVLERQGGDVLGVDVFAFVADVRRQGGVLVVGGDPRDLLPG